MNLKKAAILSLSFLGIMATDTVAPLIRQMGLSFPNISPAILKLTITLPSLLAIFFSLLSGQLVRVISKKAVLAIALALYSVGGIAGGWTETFSSHLIMRALLGAGTGMISPIVTSLIADFYHGKARADMIGYSFAVSHFGGVVTPPLASFVGANDWRLAFLIYLIAPVIFAGAMLFIPKSTRFSSNKAVKIKEPIPGKVIWISVVSLIIVIFFFIIITDISFLIEAKPNMAGYVTTFGLAVSTFGSTFTGLSFSWLYVKLKQWIIPTGFLIAAFGFWLTTYSENSIAMLLGLFCTGLGVGLIFSLVTLLTANSTGEADSTAALAVVNSAFSVGMFASPFFYSMLPQLFSAETPILFNFRAATIFFTTMGVISLAAIFIKNKDTLVTEKV